MWRSRRFLTMAWPSLVAAVVIALALVGHGSRPMQAAVDPAAARSGPQVTIDNFQFGPARLTVPVGTTVTWTNQDDMVHTVTSSTKAFSSQGLETGESFSHTFDKPGTYEYFCALHPRMTGSVVVQ